MDIYLHTLGCRLNEAEMEGWARDLSASGHRVVRGPEQAQVVVLNTCAVTAAAARKSRQAVSRLHRHNPSARLVITGCYAEMDPKRVAELAGVDLVIGNQDKARLVALIEAAIDPTSMPEIATEPDEQHLFAASRTRAFVKVQDGCRNQCSFCVVTRLRGQERSKPVEQVVDEINALRDEGFNEVVITGVHLGGYGSDIGADLRGLLLRVLSDTDIPQIRVTSLEPWDLPDDFFALWANPRLGAHLHLPLQSGCDSVLRRMARRCMTGDFRRLVASARAVIPELTLTTDVIVGFPGETQAEWEATLAFVEEVGFAHLHIFTWSPRAGTRASTLPDRVPADLQRARSQEIHALGEVMKAAHMARFVGQVRPVLWEGSGEPEDGGWRWQGYTDNYLRVEVIAPEGVALRNQRLPTRLGGHDGERYQGVLVDAPASAPRAQSAEGMSSST